MKTHREQLHTQQTNLQNHYYPSPKDLDSPQVMRDRPISSTDTNHISPVQQSNGGSTVLIGSQSTANLGRASGFHSNLGADKFSIQNMDAHHYNKESMKGLQHNLSQKNMATIKSLKTERGSSHQHQNLQDQYQGINKNLEFRVVGGQVQNKNRKQSEYEVTSSSGNMNEDTTPMHIHNLKQQILAEEFYRKPQNGLQLQNDESDLISEGAMKSSNPHGFMNPTYGNSNTNSIGQQVINIYGGSSNMNAYSQSTGNSKQSGLTKQQLKDLKQVTCTEFDLTAKEINSNKRFGADRQLKKNTIISGLTDHSPIDGQPSNSETVKWAFTKQDSQETQKKISIINRDSLNTGGQDMISKSLKSHDSRAHLSNQTNSQAKMPALRGKMLDFANLDNTENLPQNLDSDILYNNDSNQSLKPAGDKLNHHDLEEEKMISFLEGETELLMTSNKKAATAALKSQAIMSNQKIAGIQYKQQSDRLKNRKYCSLLKFNLPEHMQSMIENTQDCPLCNKQKIFDSSLQCSRFEEPRSGQDVIQINLNKKYLTSKEYYNVKIINDIIYNEATHIVSVFKDYLIYDDISEFLRRYYNKLEALQRLPKMYSFYEQFAKVFPNYVILPENKYLFKNIERKQKVIDEKQRVIQEQEERKRREAEGYQLGQSAEKTNRTRHRDRFSSQQIQNSSNNSNFSTDRMFNSKFIDSVAQIQPSGIIESMMSSRIHNSQYQEHALNSSILIHQHLQQNMENAAKIKQNKKKALHELDFGELISKFISKDSQSTIQQSSIMHQQTIDNRKRPEEEVKLESNSNQYPRPQSSNQIVKKPQVYEYQEMTRMQPNQPLQQPVGSSTILNTENSKTLSDGVSSQRPTSSKQKIDSNIKDVLLPKISDTKQINQQRPSSKDQNLQQQRDLQQHKEIVNQQLQQIQIPQHQPSSSNHLIINNYVPDQTQLQTQCDIIINIGSSNYNKYPHEQNPPLHQAQQQASIKIISNVQDGQSQIVHLPGNHTQRTQDNPLNDVVKLVQNPNNNAIAASSRQGSLQRSQSRSNLHNIHSSQKSADANNKNCHTPNKTGQKQEIKTPGSGKPGETQIKTNLVQQKILKRIKQHNKQDQMQQNDMMSNMISISANNKSASIIQKSQKVDHTSSPLNLYTQRQQIYTMNANSVKGGATEAVVSRELSKDKQRSNQPQFQQQSLPKSALFQNQPSASQNNQGNSNQMFKNDALQNLAVKFQQDRYQQAEYNTQQAQSKVLMPQNSNTNIRSVERLNKIEEEIQRDYSKYVNEYGLSKTAFAKAVNQLREKQQVPNPAANNFQSVYSQPATTRQVRHVTNSQEKKRTGSNNPRSGSTSQQRKTSNSRQPNPKSNALPQESANDLYLNRNDSKQIRSVRTKAYLSSQNSSSCFQRSQKLSPDKVSTSNFGIQNMMGLTQNLGSNFNSNTSNYITLKAQPSKQAKGFKIKFPINQQQQRASSKNNQSQNQTPKRIKLQKTKSTSNIPIAFTHRSQNGGNQLMNSRGRVGAINSGDMMILDEMSGATVNPYAHGQTSRFDLYQNQDNTQSLYGNGAVGAYPIQNFNSNSCIGTLTTTSILNSPLSFKNNLGFTHQQQMLQQQSLQQNQSSTRNNSKGKQSRNQANSQHQSQKSLTGSHQRASSNNGVLQTSTNKKKSLAMLATSNNESKRMSSGSNMSKKAIQSSQGTTPAHHQPTSSNVNQQILQLLMSYQNQQHMNEQCDVTSSSNINNTFKLLQNSSNTQSMKDLKTLKQMTTSSSGLMKDIQIIKAQKQMQPTQILQSQLNPPSYLNTQRSAANIQSILMVDNQNTKKINVQKIAGKMTTRADSNKKIQNHHNIGGQPKENISNNEGLSSYPINSTHYASTSNFGGLSGFGSSDLSTRIQQMNGQAANYNSSEDLKRILNSSKSQENLEMIRVAAQRAAIEQQQQSQYYNSTLSSSQIGQNKFLQNLKQQENQVSISNKIKMLPSNILAQLPLQSARGNVQTDPRIMHQNMMQSEQLLQHSQNQVQFSKGATNIIIGNGQNFEKPNSRRTSGKFNPQSTRSNQ